MPGSREAAARTQQALTTVQGQARGLCGARPALQLLGGDQTQDPSDLWPTLLPLSQTGGAEEQDSSVD